MPSGLLLWVSVALGISEALALVPGLSPGFQGILSSIISIGKKLLS